MTSIGSMLSRMLHESFEAKAGRINASTGGWMFDPPKWLIDKTIRINRFLADGTGKLFSRLDGDGQVIFIVIQRTVTCPNKELCEGQYPRLNRPRPADSPLWYLPESICRKCKHREKASRKFRFPRCLLRASESPGKDAIKETFGCLQKAVSETEKIMGR